MNADANPSVQDLAVLIVEDRYLIASDIAHQIQLLGARVAGVAPSPARANEILDETHIDLAVLDINLDGDRIFPLAERLAEESVMFLFLTGYDEFLLPAKWRGRPRLSKPLDGRALREAIIGLVAASGRETNS